MCTLTQSRGRLIRSQKIEIQQKGGGSLRRIEKRKEIGKEQNPLFLGEGIF